MTDFVLEQYESTKNPTLFEETVHNYANFLKQPLTLGMFVPSDDDGNVLEKPSHYELYVLGIAPNEIQIDVCGKYEIALSKVLFNGFSCINEFLINNKNHCSINKYDLNRTSIELLIVYDLDCTVSF